MERFNRVVDAFLREVALEKPQTLEKLNERFAVWLSECYHHQPHSALGEDVTPESAFRSDPRPLRFVDPDALAHAFLHVETRKVDKSGCISFLNRKYEVGLALIGCTVDVIYDPADTTELTIEYEGHEPWTVRPLVIGEQTGKRPKLPDHLQPAPAESSRLLEAAHERHQERRERQIPAVSYRNVQKGELGDV